MSMSNFLDRLYWLFTGDCRYHCHRDDVYGLVPEAGCPIHDVHLYEGFR